MMAIDPINGRTVFGVAALSCRFRRILTTELSSRIKRRGIGNRALSQLGQMQNPNAALIVQNLTLESLANAANGLTDFKATRCIAIPKKTGFNVVVEGAWGGKKITLKGDI